MGPPIILTVIVIHVQMVNATSSVYPLELQTKPIKDSLRVEMIYFLSKSRVFL
jgi:hypothetical protein